MTRIYTHTTIAALLIKPSSCSKTNGRETCSKEGSLFIEEPICLSTLETQLLTIKISISQRARDKEDKTYPSRARRRGQRGVFHGSKITRQSKFLQVFSNSLEGEDKTVHIKETSPLFSLLNRTMEKQRKLAGRPMGSYGDIAPRQNPLWSL